MALDPKAWTKQRTATPMNGQLLTAVGVVKVDPAATMDDAWEAPAELDQTRPAKAIKPQRDHFLLEVFGPSSHLPANLLEGLELELLPKSWDIAFLGAGSLPLFRILCAQQLHCPPFL
jgi:hypothetical protein